MVNTDNLIPLECCDHHFLHPIKFMVWGRRYNKWLEKTAKDMQLGKSEAYHMHGGKENSIYITEEKARLIQSRPLRPKVIQT